MKRLVLVTFFASACLSLPAQADRDVDRLIAASQAEASPLFFTLPATAGALDISGFSNDREFYERGGLPNFFAKAAAGRPVVVAYIGGSITQAHYGYRLQSAGHIQSMFPATPFKWINAGVSGTGTDLGACRLGEQVLAYFPDLVFVEFAVNGAYRDGMEGIVRQIKKASPRTDICFVYTVFSSQPAVYAEGSMPQNIQGLEEIAEHYGIPSVHMGLQPALLEASGELVWKGDTAVIRDRIVFSTDGTHPVPAGGRLYAAAVARAFERMKNGAKATTVLPSPLLPTAWDDATMLDPLQSATFTGEWKKINPAKEPGLGGFRGWFPYLMTADKSGASFTVRFRGSMVGLFDIGGPEAGQLRIEIDGRPVCLKDRAIRGTHLFRAVTKDSAGGVALLNRFNAFCNNRYRGQYECIELEPGRHTVTFTLSAEMCDKKAVLGPNQLADITAHPEKYNRTVVYIGKILVRGTTETGD